MSSELFALSMLESEKEMKQIQILTALAMTSLTARLKEIFFL